MKQADHATCCIVGGGPAGIFLGYLLARSGLSVIVLEKHADFLRDFRGDTIHPSTMNLLKELDLLDEFLPLVDFRTAAPEINLNGHRYLGPKFSQLNTACPFIGFIPQWDFLNLLSRKAGDFPNFDLRMNTTAVDVLRQGERIEGVRCQGPTESYDIRADLVVAADGRSSTIRSASGHQVDNQGIPIDVLWFRLDRPSDDDGHTLGWLRDGYMLVTIPRRAHYQIAMVIQKNALQSIKSKGIEAFRQTIAHICPPLGDVARGLQDWDQVKLLTVQINRLQRWHEPGLLLIGDAAHAMSPVGGVGINLAIQDAVATANLLVDPLRQGAVSDADLAKVQRRREPATRKTQWLQLMIHARLFGKGQAPDQPFSPPWYLRLLAAPLAPILRRLAGRWIGIGFQPEHIQTTEAPYQQPSG